MIKQALIQHLEDFIKKNSLDFRVIGNIIYEHHHRNRCKHNRRAIDFDEMIYWDSVHSKSSKSILLSDPDFV